MRSALLVLGLLCLGCRNGSEDALLTNLGLAARNLTGSGELQAFVVPEFSQDGTDLNGDGDVLDQIAYVYDFATGELTGLGLAQDGPLVVEGNLVAFGVRESSEGASDLNADGDTDDDVLHVYDSATGVTTNTGLAVAGVPALGIGTVVFLVPEEFQAGDDLNGDGDALDFVLHAYDARTQVTTNAQRAVVTGPSFHDHAFAITTDEASAQADLNGDGDLTDVSIFELYDLLLGGLEQTPAALASASPPLAVGVDDWVALLDEGEMQLDLNGDGDELDGVWHDIDPHGGAQLATGFSSLSGFGSISDGSVFGLIAMEVAGVDVNADGDQLDTYAVLHDPLHGQSFSTDLALGALPLALAGGYLAFAVNESAQGADRNGDLDLDDDVLHLCAIASGSVTDTGFAVADLVAVGPGLLLWLDESQDGLDRNADGDALDLVLAKFQPGAPTLENLGLASTPPLIAVTGSFALVSISEADQGRDLNGDGDLLDAVPWRIELGFPLDSAPELETNLASATAGQGTVLADGRGLVTLSEADEGLDLNGDGDQLDAVLHRFD